MYEKTINEYEQEIIKNYQRSILDKYNAGNIDLESWIDKLYKGQIYYTVCCKCKEFINAPSLCNFAEQIEEKVNKNKIELQYKSYKDNKQEDIILCEKIKEMPKRLIM